MNKRLLLAAVAAACVTGATAQINSPEVQGYLSRGKMMYQDANFNGCIDQMLQARQLCPDARQGEEALYYLAKSTMGLGDDEALPLFESFLAQYPQSVHRQDVLMSIGDYFFTRVSYGDAIRAYERVDEGTLDLAASEDYRYRLAYSYMMLTEYDKALPLFATLSSSKEYANAARFYEAYIAYSRQDYPLALKLFKSVDTKNEPGNTADYYLSQLYFSKGDYSQALAAAKRMIAANPVPQFTVESRRIAGESLYNLGNTADAIPYLWQYVSEASDPQPSAFYILGTEEFEKQDYKAAIKLFQRAVKGDNAMTQNAYLYLGLSYLKTGNNNNALMAFENAYRMNHDSKVKETALYNYAVALSEGGKAPFSSSVSVFEDFLSQYPDSRYAPEIQEYLITGYMTDDDYNKALSSINRIPNPSQRVLAAKQRVLFVLGTRDYSAGDRALALTRFSEAREISAGDPSISNQALLWSGDCYYDNGDYNKAADCYLGYLKSASEKGDNRQLAYYNLGYTRYNQKRYADALTDFTNACNAQGSLSGATLADARNRMGDSYASLHKFSDAAAQYQKAYDLNPAAGDYALYKLALMNGFNGNYNKEIQTLDNLIDRFPSSGLIPAALLAKAESYSALGNDAKAISVYNQLVRNYGTSSYGRNGQLQLAITYLNSGDRAHAVEAYRKVIYNYPTSEEARVAAEDLKRIYAEDGKLNEYLSFINSVPNAPEVDPSELETIAYQVAENEYLSTNNTSRLRAYVRDYPNGTNIPRALYFIAEDAEDAGRYDEAYAYASRVLVSYPDAAVADEALAIKASAELHQGKGEIALQTYRELEEKASDTSMRHDARIAIMRVARDLGRYGEVVDVTEKILSSSESGNKEYNEVLYNHGLALSSLGRYDEAEKDWAQLIDNPNDVYGAKSAYYLAQSQFQRGLTSKAEKTITRFLGSGSNQNYWRARGVVLYSDILRKNGETFEADEYLRTLRNNYNGTETDIYEMIEERLK